MKNLKLTFPIIIYFVIFLTACSRRDNMFFYYGLMGAGKTGKLIESYEKNKKNCCLICAQNKATNEVGVVVARSCLNKRYTPNFVFNKDTDFCAIFREIEERSEINIMLIDDAHFLSTSQVDSIISCAKGKKMTIEFYGLMYGEGLPKEHEHYKILRGEFFSGSKRLLGINKVKKIEIKGSKCVVGYGSNDSRHDAETIIRLSDNGCVKANGITLYDKDAEHSTKHKYVPVCWKHAGIELKNGKYILDPEYKIDKSVYDKAFSIGN
jgi:thymidine kinase